MEHILGAEISYRILLDADLQVEYNLDAEIDWEIELSALLTTPSDWSVGTFSFWWSNRIPIIHLEKDPTVYEPIPNYDLRASSSPELFLELAAEIDWSITLQAELQEELNPPAVNDMEHWWANRIPIYFFWRRYYPHWTVSGERHLRLETTEEPLLNAEVDWEIELEADLVVEMALAASIDFGWDVTADLEIAENPKLLTAVIDWSITLTDRQVSLEAAVDWSIVLVSPELDEEGVNLSATIDWSIELVPETFRLTRTITPSIEPIPPLFQLSRKPRNLNPAFQPCQEIGAPRVIFYSRIDDMAQGEYICESFSIEYVLDEVGSFSFTIDSRQSVHILRLDRYLRVILHLGATRKIFGCVDKISFEDGLFSIDCSSQMWQLTRHRAKSNARYDGQPVLGILYDLLLYDADWTLGDISTMQDFLVETSIDLRDEKRLFPQVKRVIEAIPGLHVRYNFFDFDESKQQIDIGEFDERVTPPIAPGDLLGPIQRLSSYNEIVKRIEAYGGEYEVTMEDPLDSEKEITVKKTITLRDAHNFNPDLDDHPEFPLGRANGPWVVTNASVNNLVGESTVERYPEIVPSIRKDPTENQIQAAGHALWQRAVSDLKQHSVIEDEWSFSSSKVPCGLLPGDRIYVQGYYENVYIDRITGEYRVVETGTVRDWFRVISYTETFENDELVYDLKVTPNANLPSAQRQAMRLFDAIANRIREEGSTADNEDELELPAYNIMEVTVGPDEIADTFNGTTGSFYPAKEATLLPPDDLDLGTLELLKLFSTFQGQYDIRQTDPIDSDGIVRVAVSVNQDWTETDELTVYALVRYTRET